MEKTAGINGSDFLIKSFDVTEKGLNYHDNLHGNWKGIYDEVFKLMPATAFECGCGGMYHLMNIKKLLPDIIIGGCDLLQSQIDFGRRKFKVPNEILKNVSVRDFSASNGADGLGKHEFVYCHAVMMHLSQDRALPFF